LSNLFDQHKEEDMGEFKELFQSADWKTEKHVPVIDVLDTVKKGEAFQVTVTVGKDIAHPNTTAHHIRWITIFFQPNGEKNPYQVARAEFSAHGESPEGPDTSSVYTLHKATLSLKTDKPGTIHAVSLCNIHGLWQNSRKIEIE
jgi:superoxide reductase